MSVPDDDGHECRAAAYIAGQIALLGVLIGAAIIYAL